MRVVLLALLLAGCAGPKQQQQQPQTDGKRLDDSSRADGPGLPVDRPLVQDQGLPSQDGKPPSHETGSPPDQGLPHDFAPAPVGPIYGHTDTELYEVDPSTFTVKLVGAFGWPGGADSMTDIAINRNGKMIGISFSTVYAVNPKTAACTSLAPLKTSCNGLSFIASSASAPEMLVGIANNGSVYEINQTTGASTLIGTFGGGLESSGDVVSVLGAGTFVTVIAPGSATDWLASLDPATGVAKLVGDTGFKSVWGLAYWKGKLYGFTVGSDLISINVKTGKGTLMKNTSPWWWGAAVSTFAPLL